MAHPLLADPFVRTVIDDAVAPLTNRLVADDLSWLEDQLAVLLEIDPELAQLLKGAHPRNIDVSGERGPLGIDAPQSEQTPAADGTTK
jgi:hypothetical protein